MDCGNEDYSDDGYSKRPQQGSEFNILQAAKNSKIDDWESDDSENNYSYLSDSIKSISSNDEPSAVI